MPRDIVMRPPRRAPRLGRFSTTAHVLVYVLLVGMIAVDYYLLSQTLTLLLRNDSQYGSIGALMYIITAGISAAVVTIPHLVAILIKRIESGVTARGWMLIVIGLTVLWLAILCTVTLARIKAGLDASNAGGLSGLVGAQQATKVGFSWTAPDTIMAFLMLGVLFTSGALSFVTAWLSSRPLVTAVERGWARVAKQRRYRDRLVGEQVKAQQAVLQHAGEADADRARYVMAQAVLRNELEQLRSQLAVRLAQRQADPQETSQIIHELQLRRDTALEAGPTASAPPADSTPTAPSPAV